MPCLTLISLDSSYNAPPFTLLENIIPPQGMFANPLYEGILKKVYLAAQKIPFSLYMREGGLIS